MIDMEKSELTVSRFPNPHKFDGVGTETDPHFFMPYNTDICTSEDFELIKSRILKLGIKKIRMMVLPGWYEAENDDKDASFINWDGFTWDSLGMRNVIALLSVCEEYGIAVNATVWGVETYVLKWLAHHDCGFWISAPTNNEEYAENISAFLQYVMLQRGYTCIKELTVFNEPDIAFKGNSGKISFPAYAEMCRCVHERLVRDGLRDKIKLILCDSVESASDTPDEWFSCCVRELSDIADGFTTHSSSFNESTPAIRIEDWERARVELIDKTSKDRLISYTHNQIASNRISGVCTQTDIAAFERGLFYSVFFEGTLNGGGEGFIHWCLHDMRYNGYYNRFSSLMQTGLFAYKTENWRVRPLYHVMELIMNHSVPGSEVYRVISRNQTGEGGQISAVMLKAPDGHRTYFITNTSCDDCEIAVNDGSLDAADGDFLKYVYCDESCGNFDDPIKPCEKLRSSENRICTSVFSRSFTVLEEINK